MVVHLEFLASDFFCECVLCNAEVFVLLVGYMAPFFLRGRFDSDLFSAKQ